MTTIRITSFAGILPDINSRNIPRTNAQIAHNCLLWDGALRPMPQWTKFKIFVNAYSPTSYAYEYGGKFYTTGVTQEGVLLHGTPFAKNLFVGLAETSGFGDNGPGNVYQTTQYADPAYPSLWPAGIDTPKFGGSVTSSSISYISEMYSLKPVNRLIGLTFCREIGGALQEGPLAILPDQYPYGVMFEGDTIAIGLTLDGSYLAANNITHIRLYRTISGLDTGEQVANELDTDWHLIDTIPVSETNNTVNYNDGGSATTDPLDVYLKHNFYRPQFKANYFGLLESGWFYMANALGGIALSERYLHYAWPTENRLALYENVTGVVADYDNLYVGTTAKPYIVAASAGEGEQGVQISATPYTEQLPCISGSMTKVPSGAMYASNSGLVYLSKSEQRLASFNIVNSSEDVLYKEYNEDTGEYEIVSIKATVQAAYFRGMYFGFTLTRYATEANLPVSNYCYVYDVGSAVYGREPYQQLVTMDTPAKYYKGYDAYILSNAFVSAKGITLKYGNDLYHLCLPGEGSLDNGYKKRPKLWYKWKSKKFVMEGWTTFAAAKIVHDCGEAVTFTLYANCKEVWTTEICDCNPFRLPSQIAGTVFEIQVEGLSPIYEIHMAGSMQELLANG